MLIPYRFIQSFVSSELVGRHKDHWIGLQVANSQFSWSDGQGFIYTHFGKHSGSSQQGTHNIAMCHLSLVIKANTVFFQLFYHNNFYLIKLVNMTSKGHNNALQMNLQHRDGEA